MIGIYAIENTVTGECYIGQSKNIVARFQQHMAMLEKGEHHSFKLQKAYDSLGASVFVFKILEICDEELLDVKEQKWIDKLDAYDKGYNMRLQLCEDNEDNRDPRVRVRDTLYHQFKNYCTNLGLTVTEAINIIIDMEIEEYQNNICLLQSLKDTLSGGIATKEVTKHSSCEETTKPENKENKTGSVDIDDLVDAALEIKKEIGRVGRHSLMRKTGCSEHYAKLAISKMKEREGQVG